MFGRVKCRLYNLGGISLSALLTTVTIASSDVRRLGCVLRVLVKVGVVTFSAPVVEHGKVLVVTAEEVAVLRVVIFSIDETALAAFRDEFVLAAMLQPVLAVPVHSVRALPQSPAPFALWKKRE